MGDDKSNGDRPSPDVDEPTVLDPTLVLETPTGDDASLVGRTIDGTYHVEALLGRGGMGVVYRARHAVLRDVVAIKVLHAAASAGSDPAARFVREGRAARAIRHPNVVSVFDLRTSSDGITYLVMEYVEGATLRRAIARGRRFAPEETTRILEGVAAALDAAHAAGVVHRDLKPENVMLRWNGAGFDVKLLDLGIAKLREAASTLPDDDAVTLPGQALGTPRYMAPEQWGAVPRDAGLEVDGRADVYALGAIAFELLSGRPLFDGVTVAELRRRHLLEPVVVPDVPDVEPYQWTAVVRALAKDRGDRPATAGAFLTELRGGSPAHAGPTNLPAPPSPIVGRADDLRVLEALFVDDDVRLVTLTGPGGVGKTRLSIEAASRLASGSPDGVFLVRLSPVEDPALVEAAIADALGVREAAGSPLADALDARLREGRRLVVLDNVEHVVEGVGFVARLLETAPGLRILATSRTPLRLRGERVVSVAPLEVPDAADDAAFQRASPSVALFVARARAADPSFDASDVPAIVDVCARLDGLPLALELAAARARVLSPRAMLARMENRLDLLVRGPRDLPERQRTMRGAIAWSHDLLHDDERALFRSLAVFAGGFTLEAAEVVCDPDGRLPTSVADGVEALVDASLLRRQGLRFSMMATILDFARERLAESGEEPGIRRRHAEYSLALAAAAHDALFAEGGVAWLARLETERDNLRAALDWSLGADPELALELVHRLGRYWALGAHYAEGVGRIRAALDRLPDATPRQRALVLLDAGALLLMAGKPSTARDTLEASLSAAVEAEDERIAGSALANLANVAASEGDHERARALYERRLESARALGDDVMLANVLNNLGELSRDLGASDDARRYYAEALEAYRRAGNTLGETVALVNLGYLCVALDRLDEATAALADGLRGTLRTGGRHSSADAILGLAAVAAKRGAAVRAATLVGAATALADALDIDLQSGDRGLRELAVGLTLSSLGDAEFEAAVARGRALGFEEAVALALANE